MGLFQPKKVGNFDCTFCLDCVHACPQDNVGILAVAPAKSPLPKRPDVAALVLILVLGAFVSAASMTGPVMMWMHLWHARLGSMLPVTTMYYAAGQLLVPAVLLREATYHYILALVPLGFSMWFAHLFYHLLTVWSNVIPSWPPSVQVLALDLGFLLTLYLVWRRASIHGRRGALAPWVTLAIALYSFGVWILFQPMDMR